MVLLLLWCHRIYCIFKLQWKYYCARKEESFSHHINRNDFFSPANQLHSRILICCWHLLSFSHCCKVLQHYCRHLCLCSFSSSPPFIYCLSNGWFLFVLCRFSSRRISWSCWRKRQGWIVTHAGVKSRKRSTMTHATRLWTAVLAVRIGSRITSKHWRTYVLDVHCLTFHKREQLLPSLIAVARSLPSL